MKYTLMHLDREVAILDISDDSGYIKGVQRLIDARHMPLGTVLENGSADTPALRDWWLGRSIPATRSGVHHLLETLGIPDTGVLLTRSMGLSLSDQYWIRSLGSDIGWRDVNFFDNEFSEDVGDILFGTVVEGGRLNLSSPDNTSDGNQRKRWKIVDGKRCLLKSGTGYFMQKPFNEAIASAIMESQGIDHVGYEMVWVDGDPCSICEDFIDGNTELITAHYVNRTRKKPNKSTLYDHYVGCCREHGLDITPALDRMIVTDYIMVNVDRHLNNFGIVRDARSLEWLGAAPVYDTGTSLLGDLPTEIIRPETEPGCKPFGRTFLDELLLVRDTSWIDFDALEDSLDVVEGILSMDGSRITPERTEALMDVLGYRIRGLREFVGSV